MTVKKVQIISNNLRFGPMPRPDQEVEQHLTINDRGQVWLSRYRFGNGKERYPLIAEEYFQISIEEAAEILRKSAEAIDLGLDCLAEDAGWFELVLTDDSGNETKGSGALIYGENGFHKELCDYIRSVLKRNDLLLMDGNI